MRLWPTLVAALTLVAACSAPPTPPVDPLPFPEASATAAPDPTKPGPYPVGVRTVTYEDRAAGSPTARRGSS